MDNQEKIRLGREFTKFDNDESYQSDQDLKLPQPPLVKEGGSGKRIDLPMDFDNLTLNNDIIDIFYHRKSDRIFTQQAISLLELSFLLWATQGIKEIRGNNYATIRTVPCGGARHEFESYLIVKNISGLEAGLYHYLPLEDQLEQLKIIDELDEIIDNSLMGQTWATKANVIFVWSLIPYRAEWRYGIFAHRVMMMDVGHIGENLYLAGEALGLGSCGIGAFDRQVLNELFDFDGQEEYAVYAAPLGTVSKKTKERKFLTLKEKRNNE